MSTPKRQHTTPRVYLANFVDSDNRLTVYSKRRKNWLKPKPKDALIRSYYYSQPVEGVENVEHGIETEILGNLETQYPALYEQLTNDQTVNLDLMFQTLVMMRSRSPAFREAFEIGLANMVDIHFQGIPSAELPEPPKTFPDIRAHAVVTIDPHRSLTAMPHYIKEYCTSISGSSYVVATAPRGAEFLTSDNPVIWYEKGPKFAERTVYSNVLTSRTRVVFPLNKKMALFGRLRRANEPWFRRGLVGVTKEIVREANEVQVACAWDNIVGTNNLPKRVWLMATRVVPKMNIVNFDPSENKFVLAETTLGPMTAKHKHTYRFT